jgi:hypothetical protein
MAKKTTPPKTPAPAKAPTLRPGTVTAAPRSAAARTARAGEDLSKKGAAPTRARGGVSPAAATTAGAVPLRVDDADPIAHEAAMAKQAVATARTVRSKVDRFYANQFVKAGQTFSCAAADFDARTMDEVKAGTADDLAASLRPRPAQPLKAPNTRRAVADLERSRPTVIPAANPAVVEDTDLSRPTHVVPAAPVKSVL